MIWVWVSTIVAFLVSFGIIRYHLGCPEQNSGRGLLPRIFAPIRCCDGHYTERIKKKVIVHGSRATKTGSQEEILEKKTRYRTCCHCGREQELL